MIASIATEILRLQDLLVHVQKFVADIGGLGGPSPTIIDKLRLEMTRCQVDLKRWSDEIRALREIHCSRSRKLLQKVKIASDKGFFSPISLGISAHCGNISTVLGLLTWYAWTTKFSQQSANTYFQSSAIQDSIYSSKSIPRKRWSTKFESAKSILQRTYPVLSVTCERSMIAITRCRRNPFPSFSRSLKRQIIAVVRIRQKPRRRWQT